jgi:hypothetical protein
LALCLVTVLTTVGLLAPAPANAVRFEYGDITGSVDTTVSYGATWRVSERDEDLYRGLYIDGGPVDLGGNMRSVNHDNGNLNYDKGLIGSVAKVTSEMDVAYRDQFGFFVRGTGFYDWENEEGTRAKEPLSDEALDLVGSDIKLLDAFIWGEGSIGEVPVQVRLGDQVISWGESTFLLGGINATNPINISAMRIPGAELKEGLLPEGLLWGSVGATENLTLEAYYQYDWNSYTLDPAGSYFSTSDFVGDGGNSLTIAPPGQDPVFENIPGAFIPTGPFAGAPGLPLTVTRAADKNPEDSGQFGLAARLFAPGLNDTEFGLYYLNYHSRLPTINAQMMNGPTPSAAKYVVEYPEDIQLLGVSFATQLPDSGVALQGEISHKIDSPVQVDDVQVLQAALAPLIMQMTGAPDPSMVSQLVADADGYVKGYVELDITQAQMTFTKTFPQVLGANLAVLLGEVGATYVHDMPDSEELYLKVFAEPTLTDVAGDPNSKPYVDDFSWGYRLRGMLNYENVLGLFKVSPRVAWSHDVEGNSPNPGGNFIEQRMAYTVGLNTAYQSWNLDIAYTDFFGGKEDHYNNINDRDLVSAVIKYSF